MTPPPLCIGGARLAFDRPVLMGVINVTPDSFSDGGAYPGVERAVAQAQALVAAGAQILDIGGESTRPGAEGIDAATELERVVPLLEALAQAALPAWISIDTSKAEVAAAALERGARLVNDVTALADPAMAALIARHHAAVILMHMRGEPRSMQAGDLHYDDVVADVCTFLAEAAGRAVAAGIARDAILLDPGIGFGKTTAHNLQLTAGLAKLVGLGMPVVYGPSRKRFLGEITGRPVADRDRATAAICCAAVLAGAHILRVHDVAAVADAIEVAAALRDVGGADGQPARPAS